MSILLWRTEGPVVFWGTLAALVVGWLEQRIPLTLTLFLVLYLGRHLYYAAQLLAWLGGHRAELPDGNGVWGEIFHHQRLLQRRHQRRKRRLGKMLKRFRQATEALPDATVVLDAHFVIEWFNPVAARLLGLRRRDLGLRIDALLRAPAFIAHLQARRFDRPVTLPAPGNERLQLEIRIVPYTADHYLLIAQDVTQIRLLERQRRDFVAHASHELRTPITVLKGYLETLMDSGAVAEPCRPMLPRMDEQIRRLQYLIDDLLYLSRLETDRQEASRRQTVDVRAMLEDVCHDATQIKEAHARVTLRCESDACLFGSEQELRSAFSNLVVNAVHYTPADGTITVRWYDDGPQACLEVRDTGPGIAAEHLARLTERFYRVPEADASNPTGTGLGLAIVKHVLNRHGGRLEIESELGRGSVFRCRFPAERVCRPCAPSAAS